MKILFLSRWFPYPPDNGARIRVLNLIRYLTQIASVDLLAFHVKAADAEFLEMGLRECRTIGVVPYQPFHPTTIKALRGFFSMKPRSVITTHSKEMARRVKYALSGNHYDLVIASQRDMVDYLDGIDHPVALLEEMELCALYDAYIGERNLLRRFRAFLTWKKSVQYYHRILSEFRATTVVSEEEKQVVQNVSPKGHAVIVIPNGLDLTRYHGTEVQPKNFTLLYCGSLTYQANYDAVYHFLESIFPEILAVYPQAKLRVTGALQGVNLDLLPNCNNVEFTGYLEDVRPVIAKCWISIVPLRIGGGTRLKILESLAMGTPVIATLKGAQGLAIRSGEGMLIAETSRQFSQYVLDVFERPELRQALSLAGRVSVRAYDWKKIGPQFNQLIFNLVHNTENEPINLKPAS